MKTNTITTVQRLQDLIAAIEIELSAAATARLAEKASRAARSKYRKALAYAREFDLVWPAEIEAAMNAENHAQLAEQAAIDCRMEALLAAKYHAEGVEAATSIQL